jgi:ComF family protein
MTLRTVGNALLSAFIAPPCAGCARVLDHPLNGAVCDGCWHAVAVDAAPVTDRSSVLARLDAMGIYEGRLRDVIHALKYDGRRSIAPRLSRLMATHAPGALAGADFVVPVPLHRTRLRDRGFNQAADLARGLGLPVCQVLRRTKVTRPQVELPAAERRVNVRGAFALAPQSTLRAMLVPSLAVRSRIRGRIIVLVDDVTTTGATLEACAEVLLAEGAREVRGLTAARVATGRR